MTQAERTRTIKYVLTCGEQQMAAAQTKGHEDKHTGMQGKNKKEKKTEKRKVGSKAQKQASKKIVLKATNLSVSATKPGRGPCHTICHLLPALVGNGIKCHCCRCRAPPPNKSTKTKQKLPGLGGCSNSGST